MSLVLRRGIDKPCCAAKTKLGFWVIHAMTRLTTDQILKDNRTRDPDSITSLTLTHKALSDVLTTPLFSFSHYHKRYFCLS